MVAEAGHCGRGTRRPALLKRVIADATAALGLTQSAGERLTACALLALPRSESLVRAVMLRFGAARKTRPGRPCYLF